MSVIEIQPKDDAMAEIMLTIAMRLKAGTLTTDPGFMVGYNDEEGYTLQGKLSKASPYIDERRASEVIKNKEI